MSFEQILRIPGPTPIPSRVRQAMNVPMIGHRSEQAKVLMQQIQPQLHKLFQTTEDVYIMTNSGTGSLEAVIANLTSPKDEVLVAVTGNFGERFAQICDAYQLNTIRHHVTWGNQIKPEELRKTLRQYPNIHSVFLTYSETSTGVINPVQELAQVVKEETDALVIIDGVSAIGGIPFKLDAWQIDACVTSSQKALMLPPGLSLIALSKKAKQVMKQTKHTRFYLDFNKYEAKLSDPASPFTPAVSLIFGLHEALNQILEEGLENVFSRHEQMKTMTRSAMEALGFSVLAKDHAASPTVTAIVSPTISVNQLRTVAKDEFGLILAGAPNDLKESVFRIGHMGDCYPQDVLQYIGIIELVVARITGDSAHLGTGVQAAQKVYLKI